MSTLRHWVKRGVEWLKKYERNLAVFVAFLLVAVCSFQIGFIRGSGEDNGSVVLQTGPACAETTGENKVPVVGTMPVVPSAAASEKIVSESCAYVGSRNSTKYHLPSCSWAKRIKAENRVCFASKEDAEARGYSPGCVK